MTKDHFKSNRVRHRDPITKDHFKSNRVKLVMVTDLKTKLKVKQKGRRNDRHTITQTDGRGGQVDSIKASSHVVIVIVHRHHHHIPPH